MANSSFISISIKTGIVLHLMTTNNKQTQKERNQIEGNLIILRTGHLREDFSKLFCRQEKESCFSILT
jgi:hypothetical protein